ncbi:DHA2 family efflux MFS transporter permease subunit [Hahella sp. NBU794]|uniref:DHA2 family efflux MFS transporter permease subunit n=1 Tax=Hahella sp. NBU794 TaxID=3422590 RepID=UPI003D6FB7EE
MSDTLLQALFDRHGPAYRWLAMLTVMMGTVSAVLTSTIVNVALPDIMNHFSIGQGVAHWLSTGFLAAMTTTMLTTAWLTQRFGLRHALGFAMLLFAGASVLGGLGPNAESVILARVLQGAAAGMLQPIAMHVLFRVFPRNERGRAIGIYGMGVILAPALGPVLGGVIVDQLDWRYIFFAPLPITMAGFLMALRYMPHREPEVEQHGFDWTSFFYLCLFIGCALDGLTRLQHGLVQPLWQSMGALLAVSSLILFVRRQRHSRSPLLELALLRVPSFRSAFLVALGLGMALFGSTYIIPLFVQTALNYSATEAGMMMAPAGIALGILFPFSGRAADKGAPHRLVIAGLALFAGASLLWVFIGLTPSFFYLAALVLVGRVGLALMMPALSTGGLVEVSDAQLGQASGMINFARQFGGAMGINILAVMLEWGSEAGDGRHVASMLSYTEAFVLLGVIAIAALWPAARIGKTDASVQAAPESA